MTAAENGLGKKKITEKSKGWWSEEVGKNL